MKEEAKLRIDISEHIGTLKSAEEIYGLFRLLDYPENVLFDTTYKRKKNTFDFKKEDAQRIREIYSVLSFDNKLQVFLIQTSSLNPSLLRSITLTFDKQYLHYLLIFSIDYSDIVFVYPYRERIEAGKHKLKLTKLIVDKDDIHYTNVQTLATMLYEDESNWRDVWKKWSKAFSVERVTKNFFNDYKTTFFTLRKYLDRQKISRKESHEFTLQFMNRLMFVYFISKKRWLERAKFIEWLWSSYKTSGKYGSNDFYNVWLKQLFFKAFNNRSGEISGLPQDVTKTISNFPFLNGGLFRENGLDRLNINFSDKLFQSVFEFFEKYNFTIKEEMALDQEVAVDPQMLGYVYESLANVAEEIYDRNDLGIFYTPRIEVDFMCRRSIVEYLANHLPQVPKEKIYHLLFDLPEEREKLEKWYGKESLWYQLEEVLDNLSIIDPACGSGAFLVGMLNVLAEMYRVIYKNIKRGLSDFQLKSKIIENSLYGVDVMPWAIHAAELRLWLQLIVETEFSTEELRRHSLLPNLNLNLRIGDSLVQEIGGLSFSVRTNDLKGSIKKKLEALKQEKRKYFENSPTAKFKNPEEVRIEETRIFEEIINERLQNLDEEIEKLENSIKNIGRQTNLYGDVVKDKSEDLIKDKEARIAKNNEEIKKLNKIRKYLKDPEKRPFVWDIDFAEIFGDKNGFDIVIGNPPYVRQEMISPPNRLKSEVKLEDKREYKDKLINSVKTQFSIIDRIDKKSDYYIYFYFHGLSLLNDMGTFCFITSNSWLDVGYGKNLQEFLLKYAPIIAIYDNPKRSFAHAYINTIIAVFGAPKFKEDNTVGLKIRGIDNWSMLNFTARFVMFKKSFEEVLTAKNLIEIESIHTEKERGEGLTELVKNIVKKNEYRVFPIIQTDLLEDGWQYPTDYKNGRYKEGSYVGNKWGGKYLRAPDIFYTILNKGKNIFDNLNYVGKILIGLVTGANEFFMVNDHIIKKFKLKNDYFYPVMRTPKESEKIFVTKKDLKYKVLITNTLADENLKKYIKVGEKEGFHRRPTCKARTPWFSLQQKLAPIFFPYIINERHITYFNIDRVYANREVERFIPNKDELNEAYCAFLNSTIIGLFRELYGRTSLGGGALKLEVLDLQEFPVFNENTINLLKQKLEKALIKISKRSIKSIFKELSIDQSKPIREQEPNPLPDRAELDNIIFDELGLTKEERKEVYWSVCELVKQRLEKAKSLKK